MLKDMYEKPVALSEFKSKVLLVNLTGIGCGACHASIPFLNGLKGKFNAGEFEVVSIETWGREPHSLRTYADKNQINYSFCAVMKVLSSHTGLMALRPLFFILDQDRVIRKVIRGIEWGGPMKKSQMPSKHCYDKMYLRLEVTPTASRIDRHAPLPGCRYVSLCRLIISRIRATPGSCSSCIAIAS